MRDHTGLSYVVTAYKSKLNNLSHRPKSFKYPRDCFCAQSILARFNLDFGQLLKTCHTTPES